MPFASAVAFVVQHNIMPTATHGSACGSTRILRTLECLKRWLILFE